MKLENQVVSLELAKKLKELGVKQESLWYWVRQLTAGDFNKAMNEKGFWVKNKNGQDRKVKTKDLDKYGKWLLLNKDNENCTDKNWGFYSAYTVAELGEILPESLDDETGWLKIWFAKTQLGKWRISWGEKHFERANTEADARAKMLIYLLENKLTKHN